MIELIIAGLVGISIGVGSTLGIGAMNKKNAPPIIIEDKRSQIEAETVQALSDLDITLKLCEDEKHAALCRELICYQFGLQKGAASQSQCESISNINNKIELYSYCKTTDDFDKCIDIFWRRN